MVTRIEFSQKIKTKYPQYKDIDDNELADKMLAKYPQYQNEITEDAAVEEEAPVVIGTPPAGAAYRPEDQSSFDTGSITQDDRNVLQRMWGEARFDFKHKKEPMTGKTAQETTSEVVQKAVPVATGVGAFAGPHGIISSALYIGGLFGSGKFIEEVAKGEDLSDAAMSGLREGAESATLDAIVNRYGGPVLSYAGRKAAIPFKAAKEGLEKLAEPVVKSRAAIEGIEQLGKAKKEVTYQTQRAIDYFGDQARKMKDRAQVKISEVTKQYADNVTGEIDSARKAIGSVEKDIAESTFEMVKPMTEALPKVYEQLGKEYDTLLDGPLGQTAVRVDQELNDLMEIAGIKSIGGQSAKDKLVTIANQLLPAMDKSKKPANMLMEISKDYLDKGIGDGITLKDVHWLKQAVYDYSSALANRSSDQTLSHALSDIAGNISKKASDSVGGKYAALSTRYRNFKQVENFFESKIGKNVNLFGKKERAGVKTFVDEVERVVKAGGEITDDLISSQNDKIKAFHAQADLLRENGMDKAADALEGQLNGIVDGILSKQSMSKNMDALNSILKETPETANIIKRQMQDQGKEIGSKIRNLRRTQKDLLKKYGDKASELERDLIKHDDMSYIAFSTSVGALGGLSDNPGAKKLSRSIIGAYAIKRYGALAADAMNEVLNSISLKIDLSPLSKPVRNSLILAVNKVKELNQEEEEE